METIGVSKELDGKRATFFKLLFGEHHRGLICLAFIERSTKRFSETFYRYPEELEVLLEEVNRNCDNGQDIYFCPQLFRERKRQKEHVEFTPNVWADLDYCSPENLLVAPSVVLESSPDRYQAFWVFDDEVDPDDAENLAQRIAYKHADQGADRSGWDLTQLLRVPYTYNYKYPELQIVKPIVANRNTYSFDDFDELYPMVDNYIRVTASTPEIDPDLEADSLLQERRLTLNPIIWKLYTEIPEEGKWSQDLWRLMLLLQESGFTREETYVIAQNAACNKYARDGRPAHQLWKDICRAEYRVQQASRNAIVDDQEIGPLPLMSDEERKLLMESDPTFIERYISWASKLSDAAPQYHQAGALIALSSILCGAVRLPASFGTIVPNLWFMILADTTLTRKTTAMDIAMELIEEIDSDIVLATDGSIEGLLTSMSFRPNQPSVFLRDEFSGLLHQMAHKEYMAGMAELLTKLYDGKMQKRILRKETIEVRAPRLIIFAGGIKDAVLSSLSYDQVASGFIPRFIFITAESDITKVKPVGPPRPENLAEKEKIGIELLRLYEFYNTEIELMIPNQDVTITQKKFFDAQLTDEAWLRYNELESTLTQFALQADRKEIMTPAADRLAKSILKAALLIAASRQLNDELLVTELDLLRAISYGEDWFTHTRAILRRVGMGATEKQLERIVQILKDNPAGKTRSYLMQLFKLSARDYAQVMDTLEQRGLVSRTKTGRGEHVRATALADLKSI